MNESPNNNMTAGSEEQDRASERRNFFLNTTLTTEVHAQVSARVRNLSAGGMMIEFTELPNPPLRVGQRLVAELRNIGGVVGEIAWARGRRFGVKFDSEIDPELARKPLTPGETTPAYVKPVLVPSRSLKYVEGLPDR